MSRSNGKSERGSVAWNGAAAINFGDVAEAGQGDLLASPHANIALDAATPADGRFSWNCPSLELPVIQTCCPNVLNGGTLSQRRSPLGDAVQLGDAAYAAMVPKTKSKQFKPPTRQPRKLIAFDTDTMRALTLLARDRMMDFQELPDEAFRDLLKKHDRPATLKDSLKQSVRTSAND